MMVKSRSSRGIDRGPSQRAQGALGDILSGQLARYPRMEVRDLYKLLHQGALGSEHAVADIAGVRSWLECELRAIATGPAGPVDPLVEPISPDKRIVRIHLRPYVATGHNPEVLLSAFVRTSQEYRGTPETLRQYCARGLDLAAAGVLAFSPEELGEFFRRMESKGFPAVHHSQAYEAAYRPAYRVIYRDFLPVV